MRVVLLAPARLSCRPDLARLASDAGMAEALQRIATARSADAIPDPPAPVRTDRIIEEHRVSDPALVPALVWSGRLPSADAPPTAGTRLRSAAAQVTTHGVILVHLELEVDDPAALGAAEDDLCPWVSARMASLAGVVGAAVAREGLACAGTPSRRDLREDAFLWWHRLFVGELPEGVLARCQLDRYPAAELRPGVTLRVGDGYSHVACADEAEVQRVLEGIAWATQLWMVADLLQRRLTEQAGRLRLSTSLRDHERQQQAATELYEQATLETAVLLQGLRYTAGGPRQTFELAARSWNMSAQLEPLVQSTEALRQAVERRHAEARDARAAGLSRVVTALAIVSGLAVVLSVFETAVGDPIPAGPPLLRLALSALIALAAVGALLFVVRRER